MFNIGFAELILILLVAFVVVGPKDLPKVAAALGRGMRTIKQYIREFQEESGLGDVVDEFKKNLPRSGTHPEGKRSHPGSEAGAEGRGGRCAQHRRCGKGRTGEEQVTGGHAL